MKHSVNQMKDLRCDCFNKKLQKTCNALLFKYKKEGSLEIKYIEIKCHSCKNIFKSKI